MPSADSPLHIVHEDDDCLVLNKPSGISSIPERGDKDNDLSSVASKHAGTKLSAVFLLDKSVSGLIVYAKNPEAYALLSGEFEQGKLKQTYITLLHGVTKEKKGTINAPLRKFGSGRMGVAPAGYEAMEASTRYEVIERFGQHTLARAVPMTNRRHQVRVHLFSIGHPIVGDPLYGDPLLQKRYPHLLLHSHEIEFMAASGEKRNFTTPMPAYFHKWIESLKLEL